MEVGARTAVLVEGWSDQAAVETLARRRGLDFRAERILTIPIGGITNLGAFVHELGPSGLRLGLAGLCDAAGVGAGLNLSSFSRSERACSC